MEPLLPPPCVPPAPAARYAPVFEAARFKVEMVPTPLWNLTWQKSQTGGEWAKLRADTLQAAGHRCEACMGRGDLECHEQWTYDDRTCRQSLADLVALCPACHAAKTPGRAEWLVRTGQVRRDLVTEVRARIAALNGWPARTADAYIAWCAEVNAVRSLHRWIPALRAASARGEPAPVSDAEAPCGRCFALAPKAAMNAAGVGPCCA